MWNTLVYVDKRAGGEVTRRSGTTITLIRTQDSPKGGHVSVLVTRLQ